MKFRLLVFLSLLSFTATAQYVSFGANGIQRQIVGSDTTFRFSGAASGFLYQKSLNWYRANFAPLSGSSNYVSRSGNVNETITGLKSFSSTTSFSSNLNISGNILFDGGANAIRNIGINQGAIGDAKLSIQGGDGVSGHGGTITLWGNTATRAGWVTVGLSKGANAMFAIDNQGSGLGTPVLTVDTLGNLIDYGDVKIEKSTPMITLVGTQSTGRTYSITSSIPGVSNAGFTLRDNSSNVNILYFDASGKAVFSTVPSSSIAPSTGNDLTNKTYVDLKAPLASPTFTGAPTAPTPAAADNTTKLATTAYVTSAIATLDVTKTLTGSGTGIATTISIAHGLSGITTSSAVVASANTSDAAGYNYVTIDATNVNFIYTVSPVLGTNNLKYSVNIK